MPASGLLPMLSTIFAPAAGAAASAGIGATIAGGLIAGIGQGMMQKKQMKEEERMEREAEERRQATYTGAGDAVRFWDQGQEQPDEAASSTNEFQRADAKSNENLSVGQMEQRQVVGSQYSNTKPAAQTPRYRYDRKTGQIVMS